MESRIAASLTILMSCIIMTILAQDPISVNQVCLNYVDCGAEDVTPLPTKTNQRFKLVSSHSTSTKLFVGAKEQFIKIDLECNPMIEVSQQIPSCLEVKCTTGTHSILSNYPLACFNYIRFVEEVADKLLVCGTRSGEPRCYSFSNTPNTPNTPCPLTTYPAGLSFGGGLCSAEQSYNAFNNLELTSRLWFQNSTLAYIGDDLFYGSNDFSSNYLEGSTFIAKIQLGPLGTTAGPFDGTQYKAEQSEATSLANHVGRPFASVDGFVYFFYREVAYDAINTGRIVFSRVARVCQDDANEVGVSGTGKLLTFFKARLICSFPGDFPKYYNNIQDVFAVPGTGGETYFYAAFTTPVVAPHQSAMCMYRLSDINKVFDESKFKSPVNSDSIWRAVEDPTPPNAPIIPVPRPGNAADCLSAASRTADESFITANTLMNNHVLNYNTHFPVVNDMGVETADTPTDSTTDKPLFHANGVRFSAIVVDEQTGTTLDDDVLFIGTDSGEIWKATWDGTTKYNAVVLWKSADGSPITGLGLLADNTDPTKLFLFGTTYNKITKINLKYGKAQSAAQLVSIYKPYLTTDDFAAADLDALALTAISSTVVNKNFCNGHRVPLLCQGNLDPSVAASADTSWTFTATDPPAAEVAVEASELGQFITFQKLRSNVPDPLSYLYIITHKDTAGEYKCVVTWTDLADGQTKTASQTNTIQVTDCITQTYIDNQDKRKAAAKLQAQNNRDMWHTDNADFKIEPATCTGDDCPW